MWVRRRNQNRFDSRQHNWRGPNRYNWYSNPCGINCYACAVYVTVNPLGDLSGERSDIPLPPMWTTI